MSSLDPFIPLEDVANMPYPGMNFPVNLSFSPDGRQIAFLLSRENELTRQLYLMDIATQQIDLLASPPNQGNTEVNLSLEEKLRRERQRQHGVGITSYSWCPEPNSKRILYPITGDLYIQEKPGAELQLLFDKTSTGASGGAIDPQFSPDGKWIAFVQDREIYIIPCELSSTGLPQKAIQVTTGAKEIVGKSNGLACFLTQEELSRYRGFWWSPDSSSILFEQIDESNIPEFRIMHSGSDQVGATAQEDHRYPFAGGPNPIRSLAITTIRTSEQQPFGTPVWMDFNNDTDFYISRVNWLPDQTIGVQKLNRLQTELTFLRFEPTTGRSTVMIHEKSDIWVNAHYLFRSIESEDKKAFRFLWGSERTGFMHLYLYEYCPSTGGANLLGALTTGNWSVEAIEGVDLVNDKLYISGTLDSPLERHLYVTSMTPSPNGVSPPTPYRLTGAEGIHTILMDGTCKLFVDLYSNLKTPPTAFISYIPTTPQLQSGNQRAVFEWIQSNSKVLHQKIEDRVHTLNLNQKIPAPEIISFPTRDGTETLYGVVYRPDPSKYGPGPYPTLVSVYGGPHVQRVARMWSVTVDMRAQRFRDMGYLVLKVDNRGSFRRGLHFEGAIKCRMGTIEILDQQDGVNKLIQEGLTVPDRVGIYGWSYGGYMSAISLMKAPETFKIAISGAPVTSWDGYDTCYTERYMSTPQLNPDGYRVSDVMQAVSAMQPHQKLLLVHGLIDENVHFRHTARLINALIGARKHYDLLLFPGERHSPRHVADRIYMEQRIAEYVSTHL
jgi:dipeptidyl-peptidase-4